MLRSPTTFLTELIRTLLQTLLHLTYYNFIRITRQLIVEPENELNIFQGALALIVLVKG